MKTLKTADFIGQSFILAAYVLGTIWIVCVEKRWSVIGGTTAFAMLWLGGWQMMSAFVMLALGAPHHKLRVIHFATAIGYLITILAAGKIAAKLPPVTLHPFLEVVMTALAIVIPCSLAILYYTVTWWLIFPKRSTGSFLPHTSF